MASTRDLAYLILDAIKTRVSDVCVSHDDTMSQIDVQFGDTFFTVLVMEEEEEEEEEGPRVIGGLPIEQIETFDSLLDEEDAYDVERDDDEDFLEDSDE